MMMQTKLFEVRDTSTFIPVLAIQLGSDNEAERWLASRAGYGHQHAEQREYVWLVKIDGGDGGIENAAFDFHAWPKNTCGRTMMVAHGYITEHFDALEPGAVVDVEYILDRRPIPKQSERYE